jgi:hypothetical protein
MASSGRHPGTNTDTGKVRILLQTVTHLVPGNDREGKLHFIRNLTARRQWKRLFDWDQERMWPYHDDFGLDNIKCFFLIDHRGHNHDTTDDQQALVLWYRWTGDFLYVVNSCWILSYLYA